MKHKANRQPDTQQKPWFLPTSKRFVQQEALVIGGGIAGTSTARALADLGYQVTLLERHTQLASEASGNPQAVLYARLSASNTAATQWAWQGLAWILARIGQLLSQTQWSACGVIQLAVSPQAVHRQQRLMQCDWIKGIELLSPKALSDKAGIRLDYPGLWFPQAGWVDPRALCRAMAHHGNIRTHYGQNIAYLEHQAGLWKAHTTNGRSYQAPIVVVACNHHSTQFTQTQHLPLIPIRGQVTGCLATNTSRLLQSVVCHEGYIMPCHAGEHTLGATFHHKDNTMYSRDCDDVDNLRCLQRYIPALGLNEQDRITFSKVGFRCTTPDYLPIVGPVAKRESFYQQYARLSHNAKTQFTSLPDYYPGLFINTGHGAKGMLSAPLCAHMLAAHIHHEPPPVSNLLKEAVHPNRFLVRNLIRGQTSL